MDGKEDDGPISLRVDAKYIIPQVVSQVSQILSHAIRDEVTRIVNAVFTKTVREQVAEGIQGFLKGQIPISITAKDGKRELLLSSPKDYVESWAARQVGNDYLHRTQIAQKIDQVIEANVKDLLKQVIDENREMIVKRAVDTLGDRVVSRIRDGY
jgi:hypothetical protein